MLYAQDSKKFISMMVGQAKMRLMFKMLFKKHSGGLRNLKHSKLKKCIQGYEYMRQKMTIKENFIRSGIPLALVDALLLELGV